MIVEFREFWEERDERLDFGESGLAELNFLAFFVEFKLHEEPIGSVGRGKLIEWDCGEVFFCLFEVIQEYRVSGGRFRECVKSVEGSKVGRVLGHEVGQGGCLGCHEGNGGEPGGGYLGHGGQYTV